MGMWEPVHYLGVIPQVPLISKDSTVSVSLVLEVSHLEQRIKHRSSSELSPQSLLVDMLLLGIWLRGRCLPIIAVKPWAQSPANPNVATNYGLNLFNHILSNFPSHRWG